MIKVSSLHQKYLFAVFFLIGAVFLTSPEISDRTSLRLTRSKVHAQATALTPTPLPLSPQCSQRCDTDGNGIITKSDLLQYANIPTEQARIMFCTQQCPFDGLPPLTPAVTGTSPTGSVTGAPASGIVGDCSGVNPGVPDGSVDMKDVEHFRRELNKEAQPNGAPTMACDFDKNNAVDIIDFTHYIRIGYAAQNQQNPTSVPSPFVTDSPVSVTPSASPSPTLVVLPDTVATPTP